MALSLFPARAPIGRATVGGQQVDVLMTPEFARALGDLLIRVGGPEGASTDELQSAINSLAVRVVNIDSEVDAISAAIELATAQVAALLIQVDALTARVESLNAELAMAQPAGPDVTQQLADMNVLLNMQSQENPAVKGTATGSRGANVALASLLSALAKSGYVIDATSV